MKIAMLLLALLLCAGALFVDLADTNKSFELAGELNELLDGMPEEARAAIAKEAGGIPSPGRLKAGGFLSLLAALGSVLVLVFAFTKKHLLGKVIGFALGVAALSALVYPTVATGPHDGAAPRVLALVGLGIVAAQAACMWFVASRPRRG